MTLRALTAGDQAAGKRRNQLLRAWSTEHRPEFPWRKYTSPWHVLLAEMLLLRTRAETVAKLVPSLVERFPTPERMADEHLDNVEAALRPLGLRWRAQKVHQLAQSIVTEYDGVVPVDFDTLIKLPGVGPYIASATVSALTGMKVLLTDANTVRVASRVAGLHLRGDDDLVLPGCHSAGAEPPPGVSTLVDREWAIVRCAWRLFLFP